MRSHLWACALAFFACSNDDGGGTPPPNAGGSAGTAAGASGTGAGVGGGPDGSVAGTSGAGSGGRGGATGAGGSTGGNGGAAGSAGTGGGPGVGPPDFDDGDLDAPSNGGTITFQRIGAPGWYPSRRDPASGQCDAYQSGECCMARHELTGDKLTPWDEELIMTLRGPMLVKQLVVYQPVDSAAGPWQIASAWDDRTASAPLGTAFSGNGTESSGFSGVVGSECLVDVSSDRVFPCGAGSAPFCPSGGQSKHYGWEGSKLVIVLASMPHAGSDKIDAAAHCSQGTTGNWYDAPWIGLSHGELVRSGKFGSCHCYAKNPTEWYLGDGCGQFNVFEVVNDNNQYKNLELFSTNFFGYAGYVGEGPCGSNCDLSGLGAAADLIDKSNSREAAQGALAAPGDGPGAAFRRPSAGYRYFLMLLDVDSRTVQLAVIHPSKIPAALGSLLPSLPQQIDHAAIGGVLQARLPN